MSLKSDVNNIGSTVRVVDDDVMIQALLTEVLIEEGYHVISANNGREAVALLERNRVDLVITDIVMPVLNGIEVLLAARRIHPLCPVIMITGYPSVETAVRLVNLGATDYITKPFNVDLIKLTVAKVLEMKKLQAADLKPVRFSRLPLSTVPQEHTTSLYSCSCWKMRSEGRSCEATSAAF